MKLTIEGVEKLSNALRRKSSIRWDGVCRKNLTEIFNRGKQASGGSVDAEELRQSLRITQPSGGGLSGEVGYTKDYAPRVEFGYRMISGEFVPGQHFFKSNIDDQRPIFRDDLIKNLRKD